MRVSPAPAATPGRASASTWHEHTVHEALERLGVDPAHGLSGGDVRCRRDEVGHNTLVEAHRRPPWLLFIDQFRNLLIVVLLVGAVLAGLVGDWKDTAVIAVVLTINAVLGFIQEFRAERSLAALREMASPSARVRRDGTAQLVAACGG